MYCLRFVYTGRTEVPIGSFAAILYTLYTYLFHSSGTYCKDYRSYCAGGRGLVKEVPPEYA